MKLIDALKKVSEADRIENETLQVALACGFTPLHVQTFLHAHLLQLFPEHQVEISTGPFGDVAATLEELRDERVGALAVVLEWEDLDPRLGVRRLGGWGPSKLDSIVEQVQIRLSQLRLLLMQRARSAPVIISLPTLPLPPLFFTPGRQSGYWELKIKEEVLSFAVSLAMAERIRFVNEQSLALASPPSQRLNIRSHWSAGFPYHIPHAAALASFLAQLIRNPFPRKGLITDLDDTLWSGVVGDVGIQGIHWDLDHQSQGHGLYQQLLCSLSEEGVLVAVASKNDLGMVEDAFQREDLLLPKDRVFPLEVSWASKANAVSRILRAWNVGPESIVFIDDNPMELAEVKTAYPQVLCLEFPGKDPQAIYELLVHLRDLFGKSGISSEDELRLNSVRSNLLLRQAEEGSVDGFSEELLERAEAELTFSFSKSISDRRAFELINKTNQFNLNGKRFTEAAWQKHIEQKDTFVLTVSYKDRFGSLGKIAVVAGRYSGNGLLVESWVLSCRAFARRIEHHCLKFLFDTFKKGSITLDYKQTSKNGRLRSFLAEVLDRPPTPNLEISSKQFSAACPKLFHSIRELEDDRT